jgi:RNA-binding protein 25
VAPAPRLPAGVMPAKSTTLYIGKIAPSVDDGTLRALLDACGAVRSWKRVQDAETGAPKGFGFCEYEEADGVRCALRLLNGLELGGQALLLKPNTATERYIDELAARQAAEKAKAAAAAAAGEGVVAMDTDGVKAPDLAAAAAAGEEEGEDTEASKENAMLERVMALVTEHAAKSAASAAAHGGRGAAAAADEFLSSLDGGGGRRGSEGQQQQRRGGDRGGDSIARAARQLEEGFLRDKERERREAEKRRDELERAYRDAEKSWERHERCAATTLWPVKHCSRRNARSRQVQLPHPAPCACHALT